MGNFEKNKGITLIALIITIIVMLILAGVAISAITGTNGLIEQTKVANKKHVEGSLNEAVSLAKMQVALDGNPVTLENIIAKLLSQKSINDKDHIIDADYANNTAKITDKKTGAFVNIIGNEVYNIEDYIGITPEGAIYVKNHDTYYSNGYGTNKDFPIKNLVIPETINGITVTEIGEWKYMEGNWQRSYQGFSGLDIESIQLPTTLKSIPAYAFHSCKNLKNIVIPEGVETIESATFADSGLESISLPNSLITLKWGAFQYSNLKSITLPPNIKEIAANTFGSSGLESIVIPEGVTTIGYGAFGYCKNLTNIKLPNSLTTIRESAFQGCTQLESIVIPAGVTTIEKNIFKSSYGSETCTNLKNIYCVASSKPAGWNVNWNDGTTATVQWGYTE